MVDYLGCHKTNDMLGRSFDRRHVTWAIFFGVEHFGAGGGAASTGATRAETC